MKILRSQSALVVAASITVGLIAGAGGGTSSLADTIELRLLHYMDNTGNRDPLRAIIAEFEAENPDVTIAEFATEPGNVVPEAQAAAAARRPFDVVQVLNRAVIGAAVVSNARPFSEAPDGGAFMANYTENLRDSGMVDGEHYLAPHSYGTPLLYYNMDIMEEAGLDPESPPRTMQEMAEMARQVVDQTSHNGVYIITGGLDYGHQAMMTLAGSPYLEGNRAAFDTPEAIEVMQYWQDLVLDGLHPRVNDRDGSNIFSAGRMAFNATTSARLASIISAAEGNFRLGVAPFPTWGDKPRRVPNSGAGMMVTAQEPERIEASFRFLEFLSRPEISNRWSRESGYMPVSVDPSADPATVTFIEEVPPYAVLVEQMRETVPTAQWPGDRVVEAQTVMANLLTDLWENRGSAAELVPQAAAEVTRILEQSTRY